MGGGGGGAGGGIVLISARGVELGTQAVLDASGGPGGVAQQNAPTIACNGCNAGGAGGRGFIFLMDPNGIIDGLVPGSVGVVNGRTIEYDDFATGVLTTSLFDGERFDPTDLYTEIFSVGAADPTYQMMTGGNGMDITGEADQGQTMTVQVTSAQADPLNPLIPDPMTESPAETQVATISHDGVSITVTIDASLGLVNTANRDEFLRIHVTFEYTNPTDAALGPFLTIDQIRLPFEVNGP
jgi:hypothetical protein